MSFKDNFMTIVNVIKDKRALKDMAKTLSKENAKQRELEAYTNSVAKELINIFYSVADKSSLSRIELEGMIIEPKKVIKKNEGSIKDPTVLIDAVQLDEQFNLNFDVKMIRSDDGQEQYLIKRKRISF